MPEELYFSSFVRLKCDKFWNRVILVFLLSFPFKVLLSLSMLKAWGWSVLIYSHFSLFCVWPQDMFIQILLWRQISPWDFPQVASANHLPESFSATVREGEVTLDCLVLHAWLTATCLKASWTNVVIPKNILYLWVQEIERS